MFSQEYHWSVEHEELRKQHLTTIKLLDLLGAKAPEGKLPTWVYNAIREELDRLEREKWSLDFRCGLGRAGYFPRPTPPRLWEINLPEYSKC